MSAVQLPELASGWIWARLEELVTNPKQDIVDGPFGSDMKASEYRDEGVPIIRLQNVERNLFVKKNIRYISFEKARELERHSFAKNDIVITKLGSPLGKACIIPDDLEKGIIVADIVRLKVDEQFVLKKYLMYAINSDIVTGNLNLKTKGTTRPRVNLGHVRELAIPLAPLREQRRIVAKVKASLAEIKTTLEALDKVPILLRSVRRSILAKVFKGELTEQNPNDEPAQRLLERIKQERNGKQTSVNEAESAKLTELPGTWIWTSLGGIADIQMGQSPPGSSYNKEGAGYPLLNGPTEFGKEHPTPVQWTTTPTRICNKGDILICVRGNTTGRMNWADQSYCVGRGLAAISTQEGLFEIRLLFHFLLNATENIMRRTAGSTFPNLQSAELRRLPLPLAPFPEQKRMVAKIEESFSLADTIEVAVEHARERTEKIAQAIFGKAFRGELVSQDPNDEPAAKLLERIRDGSKPRSGSQKMLSACS